VQSPIHVNIISNFLWQILSSICCSIE
jgi:hypothetical protein